MKLLNIETNSFTTINYVSVEAKRIWQPIIADCNKLVQDLELLSVAEGQRKCAWRTVKTSEVWQLTRSCLDLGLSIYPIENIGSWGQGFTHKTQPAVDGKPMLTYCVITKDVNYANEYLEAFKKGDHEKQGELLGFPKCCTKFFHDNWPVNFDQVWQCATNDGYDHLYSSKHTIQLFEYQITSIPILRYIGLRVGFHIPCSFNCLESTKIARERLSICKSKKDKETAKLLLSLLSMPIEWSVLHGIALTKTPIFYFRANSMPTKDKYIIRIHGDFIPRESAVGSDFPFNLKQKCQLKVN